MCLNLSDHTKPSAAIRRDASLELVPGIAIILSAESTELTYCYQDGRYPYHVSFHILTFLLLFLEKIVIELMFHPDQRKSILDVCILISMLT